MSHLFNICILTRPTDGGGGEATFHRKISATLVGRLKSLNHIKYQQQKKKINIVELLCGLLEFTDYLIFKTVSGNCRANQNS